MNAKTTNDILFTQWLHDKISALGSSNPEFGEFLVNMIITNDLDVDIQDLDQMYGDISNFLLLNTPTPELVEFFKKTWVEYNEFICPLERTT